MFTPDVSLTPTPRRHEDLIFDVGLNTGQDTEFFLKKGFRVLAVDADPLACREAEARYADEIAAGRLAVLNRAVSETRSPLTFWICTSDRALSTASERNRDFWAARGAVFEETRVEGTTTADLVRAHGVPRYAKIDIEGFDLVCLRGFEREAAPPFVSVEVDFAAVDDLLTAAQALGYRRFALAPQSKVPDQRPPSPALEGLEVDHVFERGCSGLFGRELPEEWVDAETLRTECRRIIGQYRMAGLLKRADRLLPGSDATAALRARRFPMAGDWYDVHMRADA